jgi:Patatin-like phospholipase
MAPASSVSKPLKILAIDGGGLQAISSLLILDELLNTIAKTNGVHHSKPRPCDVFDTIAGIGAGGWLAILLGRFHMDITACLTEWYKITHSIAPRSRKEKIRMRVFKHCYFDPDRLVGQINHLTNAYGTGNYLFADKTDDVRTRHVFVAALRSDSRGYNLFRSYPIPDSAKMPDRLLEGPVNPEHFEIARAFGVTGAARYFTPPWKEKMARSGKMHFSDTKFPKPHNITELALDEMWGLYGTEVPLSVIVNIGPGLPSTCDVKQIAQRFSWGLTLPAKISSPNKRLRSLVVDDAPLPKKRNNLEREGNNAGAGSGGPTVRFNESADKALPSPGAAVRPMQRIDTFGSISERKFKQKLKRYESDIERDIKKKLDHIYQGGSKLYYRLALDQAAPGTTQNDSSASGAAFDATLNFLKIPHVGMRIDEIADRMPKMHQLSEITPLRAEVTIS